MIQFQPINDFKTINVVAALNQNFDKVKSAHLGVSRSFTLDFPSTAAWSVQELTVNFVEALVGDGVLITAPPVGTGIVYSGRVTNNKSVTVRAQNVTPGAINPPSGPFTVTLFKQ